jgi:GNAT superfamily N-acetyltransferase
MSRPPEIRPFERADLPAAAALMAARHAIALQTFPLLPARFERVDTVAELLGEVPGYSDEGWAATRGGELVGFLFGTVMFAAPDSPSARYQPPRGLMLFAHGHAAKPGEEAAAYHALFAEVAQNAVKRGIFDIAVHIPAGVPVVEEAWVELGFGRLNAFAVRDIAPLSGPVPAGGIDVRQATLADLESVVRLVDEESRFHATSPIFRAYVGPDVEANVRESLRAALADESQALLIARRAGRDVGIISAGPVRGSPLSIPDAAGYIGDTAVLDGERGEGTGTALLSAALDWLRERGYAAATLHFATANGLSRAFWKGHGFVPVLHHYKRSIDPRMAWAVPD